MSGRTYENGLTEKEAKVLKLMRENNLTVSRLPYFLMDNDRTNLKHMDFHQLAVVLKRLEDKGLIK